MIYGNFKGIRLCLNFKGILEIYCNTEICPQICQGPPVMNVGTKLLSSLPIICPEPPHFLDYMHASLIDDTLAICTVLKSILQTRLER